MWRIVICDVDEAERKQIADGVGRYCGERTREAEVKICAGWPELFETLKQADPDAVIVAQDGVEGMNTITSAHLPPRRFIWFSDLDFGLQSYRLCVSWFGRKPVTYQKLECALSRCLEGK